MAKFSLSKRITSSRPAENGLMWYECAEYDDVKEYIKGSIQKIKENFVSIGYWLKYVNSNKMYVEDGYSSIEEFAQSIYQISKSTAYYLMEINTEFSKNGNSPELSEEYKDFSKCQLQELLTLPAERRSEVTPEMTVGEIREVKRKMQPDDGMIREFCYHCLRGKIEKQDYADAKTLKEYLHNRFGKSHSGYHCNKLSYQADPKGITFRDCDKITWISLAKRVIELYKIDTITLETPKVMAGQMKIVNIEMDMSEYSKDDEYSEVHLEEHVPVSAEYENNINNIIHKEQEKCSGEFFDEDNGVSSTEELFQYRSDIETLMLIIQEWQQTHLNDSKAAYAEGLLNKLDYLHMVW